MKKTPILLWPFVLSILSVLLLGYSAWSNAPGWSTVQNLTPLKARGKRSARLPSVFADDNDNVYIAYKENQIYLLHSKDRGSTWSEPVQVSEGAAAAGRPTVTVDRDGIHVVWPALKIAPEESYQQLFYSRSEDGGQSWTRPEVLTQYDSHSRQPKLLRTRNGIALVWYEMERRELPFKEKLNPEILQKMLDNSLGTSVPQEYRDLFRSTIQVIYTNSGGRNWTRPTMVAEVLNPLEIFVPYQIDNNSLGVYWSENRRIYNRVTRNGGLNWEYDYGLEQYLDPFFVNEVAYTPEGTVLIGVPRNPFESLRIRQFNTETGEKRLISPPVFFDSFPRITYGSGEIHMVWSMTEELNNWVAYQRTDRTPPQTRIVQPAETNITSLQLRLEWIGEDDISDQLTYRWMQGNKWTQFDPGKYIVVETPMDGEYQFQVQARDEAGNIEPEPAKVQFNTYEVAPDTRFESTPPDPVKSRLVEVVWTAEDNTATNPADLDYSYRLDEESWSEFRKLRQQTFRNLHEGPHTVRVRARDDRGNIDSTPAEYTFNVILGIQVAFKTTPPVALNKRRIQLSWIGSDETDDEAALFYSHRLDGGQWSDWSISDSVILERVDEGKHVFEVRAQDEIGNQSISSLEHRFIVDLTPPDTEADLVEIAKENEYMPVISMGGTDNVSSQGGLRFEYKVGGDAWRDVPEGNGRSMVLEESVSPWSVGYQVAVRAKDEVGNVDPNPVTIDLQFPGRFLSYSLGRLGVPVFVLVLMLLAGVFIILALVAVAVLILRRRRKPEIRLDDLEEDLEEKGGDESSFGDDDLFGDADDYSSGEEKDKKKDSLFDDDDDDLFG
jgi:hypothetical protein